MRAVRAGALRHLRHREHLRPAHLPLGAAERGAGRDARLVGRLRRTGQACAVDGLQPGQGTTAARRAGHAGRPRPGAGPCRGRPAQCGLSRGRRRAARGACSHGRHLVQDPARRARHRAAGRAGQPLGQGVRAAQRRLRQRLDAAARRAPPAQRGPRLRLQRPRGLARPAVGHRSDRGAARHRHARRRGRAGALPVGVRPAGRGLRHRVRRRDAWRGGRGMKGFVALYMALDASTSTLSKVAALKRYLADAPARDAAWAVYLLAGGTPRRAVPTNELRALACEAAGLPEWLFEAGYAATGDLAEAIAYVLPDPEDRLDEPLADWMEQRILPLRKAEPAARREAVLAAWRGLSADERFMYVKL